MSSWIDLNALWKILVVGLLAGAGLPALFAIGLRALSAAPRGATVAGSSTSATGADEESVYGGNVVGLLISALCFAIVLAAIGWGIYDIVNSS